MVAVERWCPWYIGSWRMVEQRKILGRWLSGEGVRAVALATGMDARRSSPRSTSAQRALPPFSGGGVVKADLGCPASAEVSCPPFTDYGVPWDSRLGSHLLRFVRRRHRRRGVDGRAAGL